MSKPHGQPDPAEAPEARRKRLREQRLAQALRDNLRRRKQPGATTPDPAEDDAG